METKIKRLVLTFKALRRRHNRILRSYEKLANKPRCNDYANLRRTREIVDMLGDELENLLVELDKLGVDPYDDLWR